MSFTIENVINVTIETSSIKTFLMTFLKVGMSLSFMIDNCMLIFFLLNIDNTYFGLHLIKYYFTTLRFCLKTLFFIHAIFNYLRQIEN